MIVIQCNCKHCGAPLSKDKCNYCGSDFRILETPNVKSIESKKGSFSDLNSYQKAAVIIVAAFAPMAILRFYKK